MQSIYWKKKKVAYVIMAAILLYLLIRIRNCKHKADVLLKQVKPIDVWEFVADFSNMKQLNPTIVDFTIIAESGNYDHWKYSAEYSEYLSHWPHLANHAVAHFDIKANLDKKIFYIHSAHNTCLLAGLFCLDSKSEFKFSYSNSSKGTLCEEFVEYQCPAIFSSFCRREVEYQRNAIMQNLKLQFNQ